MKTTQAIARQSIPKTSLRACLTVLALGTLQPGCSTVNADDLGTEASGNGGSVGIGGTGGGAVGGSGGSGGGVVGGSGGGGALTGGGQSGVAGGVSIITDAAASAPRCPVGARTPGGSGLVPVGGVLHCAGQGFPEFSGYSTLLPAEKQPAVYMTYQSLREDWGDHASWGQAVARELATFPQFLSVQVGLSMTQDGAPEQHYEKDVADGLLDDQLDRFIAALESLARPVYLRVGYEFNGTGWNGYQPESYKAAFKHIADKVRARGLEVALVWDAVVIGNVDFAPFYPGDEYVDWWAVNLFDPGDLTSAFTTSFLAGASSASKPVLIGEATPATVGVLDGQLSWGAWFSPYFSLIHQHPEIAMFTYVNLDWRSSPNLPLWGDALLQDNAVVLQNYTSELGSDLYLHGASEVASRARFGFADTQSPNGVQHLRSARDAAGLIQWDCLDDTGLAAYLVTRDGAPLERTLYGGVVDGRLRAGQSASYSVQAIDRAGNVGPSATLEYQMPKAVQRIVNGGFDSNLERWSLSQLNGAAGTVTQVDGAAHVTLTTTTGTDWHVQLAQSIELHTGVTYQLAFRARSSISANIAAGLQQDSDPYATYVNAGPLALGTSWQSFEVSTAQAADQPSQVKFLLGNVPVGAWVEIDDVRLVETAP